MLIPRDLEEPLVTQQQGQEQIQLGLDLEPQQDLEQLQRDLEAQQLDLERRPHAQELPLEHEVLIIILRIDHHLMLEVLVVPQDLRPKAVAEAVHHEEETIKQKKQKRKIKV